MGVGKAADPGAGGEEQSAEVGEAGQKRTFPPSPSKKSPEKNSENTGRIRTGNVDDSCCSSAKNAGINNRGFACEGFETN